ncbi:sarcosine oxidase subunit beta [Sphingomonas sp. BE270]|jgi:heterotetrameric sarcosine oxidase beta subunit|uniref:sarcosine oxidase subunit beta family protein n=1 Tax=unclassified Sphingomonas TaxID=196159 RepID=UPI00053E1F4B|nr:MULTISPECIES: sarcosine oxidase subunit beta family protein [unclassified Sphingomonas]MDR7256711.1 sarcosine oxidase subunit beta [Sphingomonas sp. BE270]
MKRYSALALLKAGLTGQRGWERAWRDPEPKKSYDIVIIGGGGHGLATAYYLAKVHGLRNIAVLEKGWIGGGNTGRNTTIVRSNYRQKPLHDLFDFALDLWEGMSDALNFNVMFSPRGALFLGHSDGDMTVLAQRGDALRCDGIDADLLTRAQVQKLVPLLDMAPDARFPIHGGLIQRRGGTARHDAVAWGYARAADALGVDVIQKCEVTGFAMTGGRVSGVVTTRGAIAAGRIGICVAGNSGPVAALAGLQLPIEAQTLQAFVTEPVKPMIDTVIMSQSLHCYISQSDKGGIVLGGDPDHFPSYAQRGLPPRIEKAAAEAIALVPALSRLRMVRCWAGTTDMSFDGSPILSALPVDGLYLNGGWCYGGFKATPASGWCYAHLLATGDNHPLAAPFAFDRFARGATIDEAGVGVLPQLR